MRRHRIVHTTTLVYSAPVQASYNELRMTPLSESAQATLENRVRVRPMTWSHVYRDYWGTHVTALESLSAHLHLEIESVSTVEVASRERAADSPGWDALTDSELADRSYEWLSVSELTRPHQDIADLADSFRSAATPRVAAAELAHRVREHVAYTPGATQVHTTAAEAWEHGHGVCQDLAHITLGALRHLGVPARYVSGYLAPSRDMAVGSHAEGESHAWVEAWDGQWLPLDPTSGDEVGLDHVVVARGRDYSDVPPFKGVYAAAASSRQEVVVTFTRLA